MEEVESTPAERKSPIALVPLQARKQKGHSRGSSWWNGTIRRRRSRRPSVVADDHQFGFHRSKVSVDVKFLVRVCKQRCGELNK